MKYVVSFVLAIVIMLVMIFSVCMLSGCTKDKEPKQTVEPVEETPEVEEATDEVIEETFEVEEPTPEVPEETDIDEEGEDA